MKAIILLNGDLEVGPWCTPVIANASIVIAADGGARHAKALGLKVDELVGDFDSIEQDELLRLKKTGVGLTSLPVDKDKSDLEHALSLAQQKGATEVHLLAAAGGRFDHTLGNVLLASHPCYKTLRVWLYETLSRSLILHGPTSAHIETQINSTFSLFPLTPEVTEVTLTGARWPLTSQTLRMGSTLTLSNLALAPLSLELSSGALLLVLNDL